MKIGRDELLLSLELTRPALAVKDIVPELSNFWFDGKTVMTYDDVLAMEAACALPLKGGVKGPQLVGLLTMSRGADVEFDVKKGEEARKLSMKIGRTKASFEIMDGDKRLFTVPPTPDKHHAVVDSALCNVFGRLLRCIGQDPALPEQMGITLIPDTDTGTTALYTTDSKSLAFETVKMRWPVRLIFPASFCTQLIRLAGDDGGKLYCMAEGVLFVNEHGDRLYSRFLVSNNPLDFEGVVERNLPMAERKQFVKIPEGLAPALDRALSLLQGTNDLAQLDLAFAEKEITAKVTIKGNYAVELHDQIDGVKHKLIERRLNPQLAKRCLDLCDEFTLSANTLAFRSSETKFCYMVSVGSIPRDTTDLDDEVPF